MAVMLVPVAATAPVVQHATTVARVATAAVVQAGVLLVVVVDASATTRQRCLWATLARPVPARTSCASTSA
jgi:hypothetical protein